LVAAQLIGIAVLRHVVKVEPMASASVDEVVDLAAPSIRATLRAWAGKWDVGGAMIRTCGWHSAR
jgi:hypothetical protein